MEMRFTATEVDYFAELPTSSKRYYDAATVRAFARDLQDARKELEEAKKDSVWRDVPPGIGDVNVSWFSEGLGLFSVDHTRTLPKTPKQELIDSFVERHSMAFRCSDLNKELLEAFVKEYDKVMKPLDK